MRGRDKKEQICECVGGEGVQRRGQNGGFLEEGIKMKN